MFPCSQFQFPYGNLCLLPLVILLCHRAHCWPVTRFLFNRTLRSFSLKPLSSQQVPAFPGVWWYSIPDGGVCVCYRSAWGSSQPIFPSISGSLWIAALSSSVSATVLVVLSLRLLKVHCVLAFGSLVKTNSIGPSIAPSISPWGMPVVTRCQVGLDSADHSDTLSRMVQPGFHPTDCLYPSGPYNSAGICVEYLAEVQINKINTAQSFGTEKVISLEKTSWLCTISFWSI